MSSNYVDFRRELDAVLRRRDPQALRAFLIERGQWEPETTQDPESYMWMMIAGSPALADLHAQADRWLTAHGRAEEAEELASRRSKANKGKPGQGPAKRPPARS